MYQNNWGYDPPPPRWLADLYFNPPRGREKTADMFDQEIKHLKKFKKLLAKEEEAKKKADHAKKEHDNKGHHVKLADKIKLMIFFVALGPFIGAAWAVTVFGAMKLAWKAIESLSK